MNCREIRFLAWTLHGFVPHLRLQAVEVASDLGAQAQRARATSKTTPIRIGSPHVGIVVVTRIRAAIS
jgi:hypothetical protein